MHRRPHFPPASSSLQSPDCSATKLFLSNVQWGPFPPGESKPTARFVKLVDGELRAFVTVNDVCFDSNCTGRECDMQLIHYHKISLPTRFCHDRDCEGNHGNTELVLHGQMWGNAMVSDRTMALGLFSEVLRARVVDHWNRVVGIPIRKAVRIARNIDPAFTQKDLSRVSENSCAKVGTWLRRGGQLKAFKKKMIKIDEPYVYFDPDMVEWMCMDPNHILQSNKNFGGDQLFLDAEEKGAEFLECRMWHAMVPTEKHLRQVFGETVGTLVSGDVVARADRFPVTDYDNQNKGVMEYFDDAWEGTVKSLENVKCAVDENWCDIEYSASSLYAKHYVIARMQATGLAIRDLCEANPCMTLHWDKETTLRARVTLPNENVLLLMCPWKRWEPAWVAVANEIERVHPALHIDDRTGSDRKFELFPTSATFEWTVSAVVRGSSRDGYVLHMPLVPQKIHENGCAAKLYEVTVDISGDGRVEGQFARRHHGGLGSVRKCVSVRKGSAFIILDFETWENGGRFEDMIHDEAAYWMVMEQIEPKHRADSDRCFVGSITSHHIERNMEVFGWKVVLLVVDCVRWDLLSFPEKLDAVRKADATIDNMEEYECRWNIVAPPPFENNLSPLQQMHWKALCALATEYMLPDCQPKVYFLDGASGTGKSTLAMQFALYAAGHCQETVCYIVPNKDIAVQRGSELRKMQRIRRMYDARIVVESEDTEIRGFRAEHKICVLTPGRAIGLFVGDPDVTIFDDAHAVVPTFFEVVLHGKNHGGVVIVGDSKKRGGYSSMLRCLHVPNIFQFARSRKGIEQVIPDTEFQPQGERFKSIGFYMTHEYRERGLSLAGEEMDDDEVATLYPFLEPLVRIRITPNEYPGLAAAYQEDDVCTLWRMTLSCLFFGSSEPNFHLSSSSRDFLPKLENSLSFYLGKTVRMADAPRRTIAKDEVTNIHHLEGANDTDVVIYLAKRVMRRYNLQRQRTDAEIAFSAAQKQLVVVARDVVADARNSTCSELLNARHPVLVGAQMNTTVSSLVGIGGISKHRSRHFEIMLTYTNRCSRSEFLVGLTWAGDLVFGDKVFELLTAKSLQVNLEITESNIAPNYTAVHVPQEPRNYRELAWPLGSLSTAPACKSMWDEPIAQVMWGILQGARIQFNNVVPSNAREVWCPMPGDMYHFIEPRERQVLVFALQSQRDLVVKHSMRLGGENKFRIVEETRKFVDTPWRKTLLPTGFLRFAVRMLVDSNVEMEGQRWDCFLRSRSDLADFLVMVYSHTESRDRFANPFR